MWNVITALTSLWFMITKGMPAPLWANPHKPHVHAHPTYSTCSFQGPNKLQDCTSNPSLWHHRTPSGGSSHIVHSFSQWHQALLANVFTAQSSQALSARSAEVIQLCICPALSATSCQYVYPRPFKSLPTYSALAKNSLTCAVFDHLSPPLTWHIQYAHT